MLETHGAMHSVPQRSLGYPNEQLYTRHLRRHGHGLAGMLLAPPYNYPFTSLGFVQGGQIVSSLLMLPILGYGGHFLTRAIAKRNGSLSETEHRLIPMLLPAIVGVISCVILRHGRLAPDATVFMGCSCFLNAEYVDFLGIILIGFTFTLNSHPQHAAPVLVLICAVRVLASFGISFGVTKFVTSQHIKKRLSSVPLRFSIRNPNLLLGEEYQG